MKNEDKILQILTSMQGDISFIKADVSELKTDVSGLKSDVSELKTDVSELKTDVSELKTDVSELKTDVSELKTDVSGLKADVSGLKKDVTSMKVDIRGIKSQLNENTQIIHSLIDASKINKAEHDSFSFELAELKGEMRKGFSESREIQNSLLEMYGSHEAEIRILKRNPVYHESIAREK